MAQFTLDGQAIEFNDGQTVMQAAEQAGVYIPHLCYHREFHPHGSCRICVVEIDGRLQSACTIPAQPDMQVSNITDSVQQHRRELLEMLFVEGNHVCPACEKSGECTLQSVAEFCGMLAPTFTFQYPNRQLDASHDEFILDLNRCINCELCVRASRDVDGKSVFAIAGRGSQAKLVVNSDDGQLGSTNFARADRAASVCPVGVILPKHQGFEIPIGQREFDVTPIQQMEARDDG